MGFIMKAILCKIGLHKIIPKLPRGLFCCVTISEKEFGIKTSFGKHQERMDAGFHFTPWVVGSCIGGFFKDQLMEFGFNLDGFTKDGCFASVEGSVLWKIGTSNDDARKMSNVANVEALVVNTVKSALLLVLPKYDWNSLRAEGVKFANSVRENTYSDLYNIESIVITNLSPNRQLGKAMSDLSTVPVKIERKKQLIKSSMGILQSSNDFVLSDMWGKGDYLEKMKQVATAASSSSLILGGEAITNIGILQSKVI